MQAPKYNFEEMIERALGGDSQVQTKSVSKRAKTAREEPEEEAEVVVPAKKKRNIENLKKR